MRESERRKSSILPPPCGNKWIRRRKKEKEQFIRPFLVFSIDFFWSLSHCLTACQYISQLARGRRDQKAGCGHSASDTFNILNVATFAVENGYIVVGQARWMRRKETHLGNTWGLNEPQVKVRKLRLALERGSLEEIGLYKRFGNARYLFVHLHWK